MKEADQPMAPPERAPGDFGSKRAQGAQGARVTRLCKVCGLPIHPRRLAASPRAVTDTARCSAENLRRLRNAANRRWQEKTRDPRTPDSKTQSKTGESAVL